MNLICYHGSPGLPRDFSLVEKMLAGEFQNVISRARKGYPEYTNTEFKMDGIRLGYSWGSIESMRDALTQNTRGLLLVAPYLFQNGKTGLLKKAVLSTPIVGNYLISKSAQKIIEQFLNKSCDPHPVPKELKQTAQELENPRVLKTAALEKDITSDEVTKLLKQIKSKTIKVGIIYGDQDKTSSIQEQIDPIKNILNPDFEHIIKGAGHAIPWTHSNELAKAILKFKETL
jgi:pimeloyl-ACP methyl ester carboxylesterase